MALRVGKTVEGWERRLGDIAFIAIFIVAAIQSWGASSADLAVKALFAAPTATLLLGLAGAYLAVYNIRKNEETAFLLGVIGLSVVVLLLTTFVKMPEFFSLFLANIAVAFGVGGFIVALGLILRTGWK